MENLLLKATMPGWLEVSYPIIQTIIIIAIALCAIAITLIVLFMDSTGEGEAANSITGASGVQDSYFSKNSASTKEGRLKKLIAICSISIAVLTIVYFIFAKIISIFA